MALCGKEGRGVLSSAHLVPSGLSSHKAHVPGREAAIGWKLLNFSDVGHLAFVAGKVQVSGVGSQHPTILETGAEPSNPFSLLPYSTQRS